MMYTFMNESIEAIVNGLSIQPNDEVLSICSCVQPFGFLEFLDKGNVLAIDNNPAQIKFAKRIMQLIKAKDRKAIKELNLTPKDRDYLLQGKRLDRIAANSRRIRYQVMDVENASQLTQTFTKGYFSNTPINLVKCRSLFKAGALVYVTFATELLPYSIPDFIQQREAGWECRLSDSYNIDIERTSAACHLEQTKKLGYHEDNVLLDRAFTDWTPCVFVRK